MNIIDNSVTWIYAKLRATTTWEGDRVKPKKFDRNEICIFMSGTFFISIGAYLLSEGKNSAGGTMLGVGLFTYGVCAFTVCRRYLMIKPIEKARMMEEGIIRQIKNAVGPIFLVSETQLPLIDDIWRLIFSNYLKCGDIFNIGMTCKKFYRLSSEDGIWKNLMLLDNIPISDLQIDFKKAYLLEHHKKKLKMINQNMERAAEK